MHPELNTFALLQLPFRQGAELLKLLPNILGQEVPGSVLLRLDLVLNSSIRAESTSFNKKDDAKLKNPRTNAQAAAPFSGKSALPSCDCPVHGKCLLETDEAKRLLQLNDP